MGSYALRLENGADTAVRVRMGDSIPFLSNGTVGGRSGVRNDGGAEVSVIEGSMQVTVSPFVSWIDGGTSDSQGGYPFICDTEQAFTLADGDASQDRIDTVAVVVHDNAFDGSGLTDAAVVVIQGTPGGGAPALTGTVMPLRDILVPAGLSAGTGGLSSSNLQADRRSFLPTGTTRVMDATARDALTVERGTVVWNEATGALEVWNGSIWEAYKKDDGLKIQRGTVTVPASSSSPSSSIDITFPESFAGTPTVTGSATGTSVVMVAFNSVTATGCRIYGRDVVHADVFGATEVMWTAVGPA